LDDGEADVQSLLTRISEPEMREKLVREDELKDADASFRLIYLDDEISNSGGRIGQVGKATLSGRHG
jgi:hypothetical protein